MALKKAELQIIGEKKTEKVKVLFNPNEYKITSAKKFKWIQPVGAERPIKQYVGSEVPQLEVELFFDTYGTPQPESKKKDVRTYTEKVMAAMKVDAGLHQPPEVKFVWGSLNFQGVLTKATQTFTMFLDSGKPVRAKIAITLESVDTLEALMKKTPLESPDRTKHRILKQEEKLWQMAAKEYDNPSEWKRIAKANSIANPRVLSSGTRIKVPNIHES